MRADLLALVAGHYAQAGQHKGATPSVFLLLEQDQALFEQPYRTGLLALVAGDTGQIVVQPRDRPCAALITK